MKKWQGHQKGVNFGGWFSQCFPDEKHYDSFITEPDFDTVSNKWGCDHVRVPVDYILVEDNDGTPKEAGMRRIERCAELCAKYGLNMILDLHTAFGYSFASDGGFFKDEALQKRFYDLWERFAERFSDRSDMLAFELLNEITDPSYAAVWRDISLRCIERIRAHAPDTVILIGGHSYNSAVAVPELPAPPDENIVYNFHNYDPKVFTHQGAGWMPELASVRTPYLSDMAEMLEFSERIYPGITAEYRGIKTKTCGAEMYMELFAAAAEYAEKNGVPLYCGEYGVIDRATPEDTLKWYREIHKAFQALSIGRAAWSYRRMDFGLSDERMSGVIDELVQYL
ncbi:MAG: cellulase family glycosylhydrolase [Oscillospiraceae bacterium]|nr:cellulase family glycosylhydrolase [Oscillospiraceae bacterium]